MVQFNVFFRVAGHAARRLGRKVEQGPDGITRALPRCQLHDLPNQHQHEDHRRCLEIDWRHSHAIRHLVGQ